MISYLRCDCEAKIYKRSSNHYFRDMGLLTLRWHWEKRRQLGGHANDHLFLSSIAQIILACIHASMHSF